MTRTTLRRRAPLVLAAGAALSLVAAGAADAVLTPTTDTATSLVLRDTAGDPETTLISCAGSGAVQVDATLRTAQCAQLTNLDIDLGGGVDNLTFGAVSFPALPYVQISTVDGAADTVNGGTPYADLVTADILDTVSTGTGQDRITGGLTVDGGAGNDRFVNHSYNGTITGGGGTDSVEYDLDALPSTVASFTVTAGTLLSSINGTPGSVAVSGVEQYYFSTPDGSDQADVSTIDGRNQPVRIVARMHSGIDTFYGGSGNDFVDAGPGNDVVDPGPGNDSVQGGESDDTITVRDNEVDEVDCGDGTDTVVADRGDVLKSCENVSLPPLPAPAPTPAPVTSGIVGLKSVVRGAKASFLFVSPTQGARFECRLDGRGFKSCTSPYAVRTGKLSIGKHKLYVRAVLTGGNVDASPSKFAFSVTKPKPRKHRR